VRGSLRVPWCPLWLMNLGHTLQHNNLQVKDIRRSIRAGGKSIVFSRRDHRHGGEKWDSSLGSYAE
jgi:hypothetical protein